MRYVEVASTRLAAVLLVPVCGFAQPPLPTGALTPATRSAALPGEQDSLWEGILLGGAIGLGAGATAALLAECPLARGGSRCVADRASLIALSAALGAGVGLGMDAIIGPEFTGAPLPGPPASERRGGLPPPSSRGAGVRFKVAW